MRKYVPGTLLPSDNLPDAIIAYIFNEATREMIEINCCRDSTDNILIARFLVKGRSTNSEWELLEEFEKTRKEANALFEEWMDNGFDYDWFESCEEEEEES
jgi:hypothetical protein